MANRKTLRRSTKGAAMLEFAIAFPIFFGLIFVIYDLSRIAVGYSAIRSATSIGARYAVGLSRVDWQPIQIMMAGVASIDDGTSFPMDPIFASPNGFVGWYDCMRDGEPECVAGSRTPLTKLYRPELRAIAYANMTIATNIGGSPYPCVAKNGSGQYMRGPGCFRCFTMRGSPRYQQLKNQQGLGKVFGLECEYDVPISSTSVFLGWLPRHLTLRAEALVPIPYYSEEFYETN